MGFGQHGKRLRVEYEVFGHAPGHASDRGGAVYACRPACMHPYASGDAYIFSFRFGLVPTFRGGLRTCMHCMHHSLIEDSRKGKKPLILMHTMHTRERNFIFSFIYKGFRAFSGLFLYASPDAYRCIHAYKTGRGTSPFFWVGMPGISMPGGTTLFFVPFLSHYAHSDVIVIMSQKVVIESVQIRGAAPYLGMCVASDGRQIPPVFNQSRHSDALAVRRVALPIQPVAFP